MKLGGEYASERISPKHFELLADEVGLGKPMVRMRLQELAKSVHANTQSIVIEHPTAKALSLLIQTRCQKILQKMP